MDRQVVCAGGLEIYGANALLRSVVVAEQRRDMGVGLALIGKIMTLAIDRDAALNGFTDCATPATIVVAQFDRPCPPMCSTISKGSDSGSARPYTCQGSLAP